MILNVVDKDRRKGVVGMGMDGEERRRAKRDDLGGWLVDGDGEEDGGRWDEGRGAEGEAEAEGEEERRKRREREELTRTLIEACGGEIEEDEELDREAERIRRKRRKEELERRGKSVRHFLAVDC